MKRKNCANPVAVENLETRCLCSATVAATHPVPPFPIVVGTYQGNAVFTNGAVMAETLTVVKQKSASFSGATSQANGANGNLKGVITRAGKVHIVDRGTLVKFVSVGSGTFANSTFTIRFHTGKLVGKLTLALVQL